MRLAEGKRGTMNTKLVINRGTLLGTKKEKQTARWKMTEVRTEDREICADKERNSSYSVLSCFHLLIHDFNVILFYRT